MRPEFLKIEDFFGRCYYSPNGVYKIIKQSGYGDIDNRESFTRGAIALIKDKKMLFKKEFLRPEGFVVSNTGIVFGYDIALSPNDIKTLFVFNQTGTLVSRIKIHAYPGASAISEDGRYIAFETHLSKFSDSDSLIVVDLQDQKMVLKRLRPVGCIVELKVEAGILDVRLTDRQCKYAF